MKYSEVARHVRELRELADFLEAHGVALPYAHVTTTVNVYLTETNYKRDEATGEYEKTINEEGTKANLKKFLDAVGACEKDYRDDRIRIVKKYSDGETHMIVGSIDRSVACKKVVKGQKLQPAVFTQAKIVDEYEWECDEGLSLKKLVADL